jgi:chromosome transmission fidelity protein 18
MWVDKYTSYKFFDLLTDEVVNRNVLTWLKSWDEIVFPNKSKVNLRMPDSVTRQPGHQFKKDMSFRKVDANGTVYYASAEQEYT